MSKCLMCNQDSAPEVSLSFLASFQTIPRFTRCARCMSQMEPLRGSSLKVCPLCSRKQTDTSLCKDCVRWNNDYPGHTFKNESLYTYEGLVKDWLERYKIYGDVRLGEVFSKEIHAYLHPYVKKKYLVVPIPSDEQRNEERGYNQVSYMLECAKVAYTPLLFKKEIHGKQSEKNRKERMNTPQMFELTSTFKASIKSRKIILIDDVYTTGRTMFHAVELLKASGAVEVRSLTIAR